MADFQPHGGTAIEQHGRVLVFRSQTHINKEEVGRLQQETAKRMCGLAGKRWAILGVIDRPILLTPDAEAAARVGLPQMVALGLAAQAVAFPNPEDRSLVEAQASRIVNGTIPMRFFDRPEDAEDWLNALLGAD